MAEIARQVGASSDDCYRRWWPAYWDISETDQTVGLWSAANCQIGGGMRFTNVTIPQGATIEDGTKLILRCKVSGSGTVCNARISAEDVDDAPTFADNAAAFDTRRANRTIAGVDWDAIPAWTAGEDYNSPEIKTVIQEIVDREGWVSGQDIVIFWDDFDDRSTRPGEAVRTATSYDGDPEFAPKLVIKYAIAPPVVGRSYGYIIG